MNLKIPSLIVGISILISIFVNNYFSDDRYSSYYVENEEYSNFFVTYVTDKMTGNVERITYKVFTDPLNRRKIEDVYVERLDMGSGKYKVTKIKQDIKFDPDLFLKKYSKEEDIFDRIEN